MKKISILLFALFIGMATAFAQTATTDGSATVEEQPEYGRRILIPKFSECWELTGKIGTQAYLGEYVHCWPHFKFQDWWNFPAVDVNLSKWGTHSVGFTLGFTASHLKTLYGRSERDICTFATDNDPLYTNYEQRPGHAPFYVASGWMGNAYLQAMFDLGNMFFGYKPDRFFTIVASMGGGIMVPLSETKTKEICASFNAGLTNRFRLNQHLYLDLAVRGTLHDDMFNGISYYTSTDKFNWSVDATIGATVGITYRFNFNGSDQMKKPLDDVEFKTVNDVLPYNETYQEVQKDLKVANAGLVEANTALAIANDKLAQAEADTVRVYKPEPIMYRHMVNFVIDRWEISNREKVGIMFAAELIKEHPDHKFLVKGYADMQTATPDHNVMLSRNRADVVYDCLVNEFGINPDQLEKSYYGGVDYMFYDDKQCSRSVIISSIEYEE